MKKKERIIKNIKETKFLTEDEDIMYFYDNALRYIKAIKENRMICNIARISKSGMTREIKFLECTKNKWSRERHFQYLNFYTLFDDLGFKHGLNHGTFKISGCGMDMIFHTNYTIMHKLKRLGFITSKECEKLAQETPTVI